MHPIGETASTGPAERLGVLLLCAVPPGSAGTVLDHVRALRRLSKHRVSCFPHLGVAGSRLPEAIDLEDYDAIVLHYSVYLLSQDYLGQREFARIAAFKGTKALFLQDEYREVDRMVGIIGKLGIDVLFTCVPEAEVEKVYSKSRLPKLTTISNLTGYVPTSLVRRRVGSIASRPIDVGYRGRTVPYWLGKLGAEKWQIAPRFLEATKGAGLNCDIAIREEDRIYGRRWIRFIASCKATLGVESGASVFDFDGSIRRAVEDHVAANPLASFEEVESRFLRQHEGRIRLNQISPRCFEAAALRTAMVLFEGEYSGVLQPWKHYIPLRKDFSNIDEVVAAIKDASMLQSLADAAYRDVALDPRWSYEAFTRRFDDALQVAHGAKRQALRPKVSRLGFAAVVLPAALLALLLRLWLSVPNGLRAQLRPAIRPLVAALRR